MYNYGNSLTRDVFVMKKLILGLLVVFVLFLSGCEEYADGYTEPCLLAESVGYPIDPVDVCGYSGKDEYNKEIESHTEIDGSRGLTSANVRLRWVDDGIIWQHRPDVIFDLTQIEYHHEFIHREDGFRLVFLTDIVVHNFSVLSVSTNYHYFSDNAPEEERRYNVEQVLYTLDILTPEIPFVVTGLKLGCAGVAVSGFSFVDCEGITRYFAFADNPKEAWPFVLIIREF